MQCEFCENEAIEIEEYCHRCGREWVCFGCLEDEWCPDCVGRRANADRE
jgi:hypothetical protein